MKKVTVIAMKNLLIVLMLLAIATDSFAQSITTSITTLGNFIIAEDTVTPASGVPLSSYAGVTAVAGSNGSYQPVSPTCIYTGTGAVNPSLIAYVWDTSMWPSDAYTFQTYLIKPNSKLFADCSNFTANGTIYAGPVNVVGVPLVTAGCTTIPGSPTEVGAPCFSRLAYPAFVNPQDPVSYGADKTGVNDSTVAFQCAINAGDLNISQPGTYLINGATGNCSANTHGVIPPSNRRIECAAGVTLKTTLHNSTFTGIFNIGWSGAVSNVTIAGCDFQGANVGSDPRPLDSNQSNFLVVMGGNSSSITTEGNTFEYPFANSSLEVFGCTNCIVQYNTFSHSALYGPNVQYGTNVVLQNNLTTDGDIGWEDNECPGTQPGTGLLTSNEVVYQNGNCARLGNSGCPNGINLYGGGFPSGCNYSGINVNNNYCTGTDGVQHATIYNQNSGGGFPTYSNDILGPGCSCLNGTSC